MNEYAKFKHGVTLPGIASHPDLPKLSEIKLYPMDFSWQAKNSEAIEKNRESLFSK